MNKKKPTHIDLFSGVGGIATGFKAAGIDTVLAVEYVDSCCETYEANHPETKLINSDIRNVSDETIKTELEKMGIASVDIVSGGFPCETFSTAGSNSRVYDDHRNFLYKEAIRIANAANAKLLMLENVPAFLSKKVEKGSETKIYDLLIEDLEKAGYVHHSYTLVNAHELGVPQTRTRFILIASKTTPISKIDLSEYFKPKIVSVWESMGDLPQIPDNAESNEYADTELNEYQMLMRTPSEWGVSVKSDVLSYHITPKHRPGTIERFKLIKSGEGLKDLFMRLTEEEQQKLQNEKVLPKKWYIQRNYRLDPNKPSKTVTSHCLDELLHPHLHRGLSVREAARLQSFPDWYDFKGGPIICPHMYKTQDKYEQIGDAVPPLMAKTLGIYLKNLL